jgi:hypothetical protein
LHHNKHCLTIGAHYNLCKYATPGITHTQSNNLYSIKQLKILQICLTGLALHHNKIPEMEQHHGSLHIRKLCLETRTDQCLQSDDAGGSSGRQQQLGEAAAALVRQGWVGGSTGARVGGWRWVLGSRIRGSSGAVEAQGGSSAMVEAPSSTGGWPVVSSTAATAMAEEKARRRQRQPKRRCGSDGNG